MEDISTPFNGDDEDIFSTSIELHSIALVVVIVSGEELYSLIFLCCGGVDDCKRQVLINISRCGVCCKAFAVLRCILNLKCNYRLMYLTFNILSILIILQRKCFRRTMRCH